MKMRLLITDSCNRECDGCCNQQWDLPALPVAAVYEVAEASEIILTGGEPMLNPARVLKIIEALRTQSVAPIYMYTAHLEDVQASIAVLRALDGMTVTLHDFDDALPFLLFNYRMKEFFQPGDKSLRLNVFKKARINPLWHPDDLAYWDVKRGIEWVKDCPLPEGEIFRRYYPYGRTVD